MMGQFPTEKQGALAGMFAFACFRLWLAASSVGGPHSPSSNFAHASHCRQLASVVALGSQPKRSRSAYSDSSIEAEG
jgi:hypothetical protein